MKILAFDRRSDLSVLEKHLKSFYPNDLIFKGFTDTKSLLSAAEKDSFDIVFADLDIDNKNGMFMLQGLTHSYPRRNYIGTSYYPDNGDAVTLFGMNASGYINKPFDSAKITAALKNLRYR